MNINILTPPSCPVLSSARILDAGSDNPDSTMMAAHILQDSFIFLDWINTEPNTFDLPDNWIELFNLWNWFYWHGMHYELWIWLNKIIEILRTLLSLFRQRSKVTCKQLLVIGCQDARPGMLDSALSNNAAKNIKQQDSVLTLFEGCNCEQ